MWEFFWWMISGDDDFGETSLVDSSNAQTPSHTTSTVTTISPPSSVTTVMPTAAELTGISSETPKAVVSSISSTLNRTTISTTITPTSTPSSSSSTSYPMSSSTTRNPTSSVTTRIPSFCASPLGHSSHPIASTSPFPHSSINSPPTVLASPYAPTTTVLTGTPASSTVTVATTKTNFDHFPVSSDHPISVLPPASSIGNGGEENDFEEQPFNAIKSKGPSKDIPLVANRFHDYFDIVGKEIPGRKTRIFDTNTHRQIFSVLMDYAETLGRGEFENKSGTCSTTLVGAKGIGKTECFLNFVHLASTFVPNVIVIYINFHEIDSDGSLFRTLSLSQILEIELGKYGVCAIESKNGDLPRPLWLKLLVGLNKVNLRLLLLVDEFEQLYRCISCAKTSITTLNEVAAFGSQRSGRISVILCGSSAMMENLVSANASQLVLEEFKLLKENGIPNLNCTKYRIKWVNSATPVDLKALASILGIACDEQHLPYLRLVAYRTGCKPRSVQRLLKEIRTGAFLHGPSAPENTIDGWSTLSTKAIHLLRSLILDALWDKNANILHNIFGDGTKSEAEIVESICRVDWEKRLQPIKYSEVEEAWKKQIVEDEDLLGISDFDVLYGVLHLVDRCWLAFNEVEENSVPSQIYPCTLENLVGKVRQHAELSSIWSHGQAILRNVSASGSQFFDNSTIIDRGTTGAAASQFCTIC